MANTNTQKTFTLVTGASSGIGLELARVFARNGHNLILVARSEGKLVELKNEVEAKHSISAEVIPADLADPNAVGKVFDEIKKRGFEVDILVNNAGFGAAGEFATQTEWIKEKEMLQVNIVALTELCKVFLPQMVARKYGRILNVASTAAFQPGPLMAIYFASKAYVLHFSEAIAEELAGTGVTVTALCPGATKSNFQHVADMDESRLFKDRKLPTSREVAEFGYEKLMQGQRVAIHGLKNYLMAQGVRLSPRALITKVAKRFQERKND